MLRPLLYLALTAGLMSCQPVAPAMAPSPPVEAETGFLSLPEAYQEQGVVPRSTDALELTVPDAGLEVPLQYDRSVEETLAWVGDGEGVAELYNQHGQLLYRVTEGEPAQAVTVNAGRHTLKISGEPGEVVTMPAVEAASSQVRSFLRVSSPSNATAGMDRFYSYDPYRWKVREGQACEALAYYYDKLGEYECLKLPKELNRKDYPFEYMYLQNRSHYVALHFRDELMRDCPELLKELQPYYMQPLEQARKDYSKLTYYCRRAQRNGKI